MYLWNSNWCINCVLMRVMERCERDIRRFRANEHTLINTQLIHQFVFRHADAVNLVLLRAGITLTSGTLWFMCVILISLYFKSRNIYILTSVVGIAISQLPLFHMLVFIELFVSISYRFMFNNRLCKIQMLNMV